MICVKKLTFCNSVGLEKKSLPTYKDSEGGFRDWDFGYLVTADKRNPQIHFGLLRKQCCPKKEFFIKVISCIHEKPKLVSSIYVIHGFEGKRPKRRWDPYFSITLGSWRRWKQTILLGLPIARGLSEQVCTTALLRVQYGTSVST